jgi:hypothetical protein
MQGHQPVDNLPVPACGPVKLLHLKQLVSLVQEASLAQLDGLRDAMAIMERVVVHNNCLNMTLLYRGLKALDDMLDGWHTLAATRATSDKPGETSMSSCPSCSGQSSTSITSHNLSCREMRHRAASWGVMRHHTAGHNTAMWPAITSLLHVDGVSVAAKVTADIGH